MYAITGFFIAVGVVSAVMFTLMMRAANRTPGQRRAYVDSSPRDTTGSYSSSSDGFNLLNWFGSSSSSSSGDSCTSLSSSLFGSSDNSSNDNSDSGCSDGGGSSDSGGGGSD